MLVLILCFLSLPFCMKKNISWEVLLNYINLMCIVFCTYFLKCIIKLLNTHLT